VNWDFEHGTFRYFNHSPHHNHFLEAIEWVLANKKPQEWQGPSFKAFQEALEHEETARWTTLITMRGHTPEEMLEGFRLLQKKGYIRHLPLVENIFPVTNPKFVHWASSPPERKPIALMQILDRIQAKAIDSNMVPILNQDGTGYERLHTLGFSDDDGGNIETMLAALGPEVVTNRWSCVKIVIFSKGKDKPRTVVMTRNGMTRPWTETEEQDFNRIVNNGRALSNPTQCRFLLEPSGDRNTNDKVTIGSHFTRLKKVGRITAKWPSL
jgi:hypothetical protein